VKRFPRIASTSLLLFALIFLLTASPGISQTQTSPAIPGEPYHGIQTGSAGIAWGDPDGEHSRYGWPFPFEQMGHLISSYQNYDPNNNPSQAYFHHGIDMVAPDGTNVRTPVRGQVVNVEQYGYNYLYWEVAILDPEGYVWQYHHIEQSSIPQAIRQAYAAWQADPVNGGFVPANSHLGNIVTWPESSFGFYFHHIHLNILAAGDIYLNPLDFLDDTYTDTQAPKVQEVGLFTGTNTLVSGNTIAYGTPYSIYLKARDLFMSQVYYLPPHRINYRIDDGELRTVWDFRQIPGGASDTQYVNKFFLPGITYGNYERREFYMDMGFTTDGVNPLPTEPGIYKMDIEIWDYSYNRATWTYRWTITEAIPDNGCANGRGVRKTITIDEDSYIEDIDLGVAIEHIARGELRVLLKGPMDSSPTVLIPDGTDTNLNYNLLIDDASTGMINDGNRDDLRPPFFNRNAGPVTDGSLDHYIGMNARGVWEVFVCDNKSGNTGKVWDLDLRILTTDNLPPTADPQDITAASGQPTGIVLTGSDPEGQPLSYRLTSQPQHGTLSGTAPNLIYTSNSDFIGTDRFSFVVNDGEIDSQEAIVTITVIPRLYLPIILCPR
jgi:subtilisin-like proprotein convertase family protein